MTPIPPVRGATVPVHAQHDQVVDIYWRLPNGQQWIEHRTCQPFTITVTYDTTRPAWAPVPDPFAEQP